VKVIVTDANLALRYLTSKLLGGAFELDINAANATVKDIADHTGLCIERTQKAVSIFVSETMYGALRLVSVEQGCGPREFALVAFGGDGPVHANAVGKLPGARPVTTSYNTTIPVRLVHSR
jgi:5-oxoprolinase (ATP-hydrolysing)